MSSNTPFVTVVIPAFNAERYITQAIDSVLHQTCGRFEVNNMSSHRCGADHLELIAITRARHARRRAAGA